MPYKILSHIGSADSCAYYRTLLPTIYCRKELAKSDILLEASSNMNQSEYDCYIFSRIPDPKSYVLINMLYSAGKKIVWDLDDELWNISPSNKGAYEYYDVTMNHFLGLYLSMSSKISVSTVPLCDSLINKFSNNSTFSDTVNKVYILENLIDTTSYDAFNIQRKFNKRKPIKIMWSGSDSHVEDMEPVLHLYDYYRRDPNVLFVIHGYMPEKLMPELPGKVVYIPFHPRKYYEGVISLLSPDVALIPLKDNQFNKCKSAIKYFEMTMAGAACICSYIDPYSDVINIDKHGYVCSNISDWIFGCDSLINDLDHMNNMSKCANADIIENYSWNVDNSRKRNWLEFFKSLAG